MSLLNLKIKFYAISNKRCQHQMKYVFCEVELEQVDEIPYLGIIITSNLKWNHHVSSVAGKAMQVLRWLDATYGIVPNKLQKRHINPSYGLSWNTQVRPGTYIIKRIK